MSDFDLATLLRPRRAESDSVVAPVIPVASVREAAAAIVAIENMDDRVEVLRYVSIDDETGGTLSVWTQAGSYAGRVESTAIGRATEGVSGAQGIVSSVPYLVHLPPTAHVLPQDRLGVPGWFNARSSSTQYAEKARVIPAGAKPTFYLVAMYGGTTGVVEPAFDAWPTQPGQTLVDGDVTWRYGGRVALLEVVGVDDAQSNAVELVVRAKDLD